MDDSYKIKYLKYKNKYLNLKNKRIQYGGINYSVDLTNDQTFDMSNLVQGDILEVKYGPNEEERIIFDFTKEDEYNVFKYKHILSSNPNLDIVLSIKNGQLVSKLRFIRAVSDKSINFTTLFNIFGCLSKKIGATKLELTDDALFYKDNNTSNAGYSALGFRVFNGKNSIYMSARELGFTPDFSLFGDSHKTNLSLPGEKCYDERLYLSDLAFLSGVKFGILRSHYIHYFERLYNMSSDGYWLFKEDIDKDDLKTLNLGNYLDYVVRSGRPYSHEYIRSLLSLLNWDLNPLIPHNDKIKEILIRYKRYMLASTNLVSNNFSCPIQNVSI